MAGAGFPEVRPTHSPVFRHIRPEGSRASELAVRARMTKQSMAYLVDDLTRAGLLQSRPDPADRRARLVSLTPRGKEAEKTLARLSTQAEGELAKQIGEEELEALRSLLRRANAH
ncbi:MAG: MarR family transcriptional regulator [Erythrobacter sp.]|nr:MarR family transcriptional regulator [Erythrobacter sp.]